MSTRTAQAFSPATMHSASVSMELTVTSGKGYVPAGNTRSEDSPIGLIPIDAIYSPVRQVAYKVDNARVGQITDYDKLLLTVETDGSVTPEDAVAYAARILQEQLQPFINFEEPKEQPSDGENEDLPFSRNLLRKVDELELSVRQKSGRRMRRRRVDLGPEGLAEGRRLLAVYSWV